MTQLKVKKVLADAIMPKFHSAGAACFDLHAVVPEGKTEVVSPGNPVIIDTGLAFEVPVGHVLLIYSRSGQGFNHNIRLANGTGIIDSDYRGDIKVKLTKDSGTRAVIKHGARIAQALLLPIPLVDLVLVDELTETERGAGRFGSTGE